MSDRSDDELFPIRTLAQLTGVNPVTLRAWERRYGVIQPRRTAKGHRLYSAADVERVQRILELMARGVPIGQARAVLEHLPEGAPAAAEDRFGRLRARMLAAAGRFDELALEAAYEEALASHPLSQVYGELIVPLLHELGHRWEGRVGTVAEEHFCAVFVRNKLGARFHHRRLDGPRPVLLVACWPGERHEIGALLFALAADEAGYRCAVLGADMPLEDLPLAAEAAGARAIVLAGAVNLGAELLAERIPALVAAAPVPVMAGGLTSIRCHDALLRVGVTPLGEDLGGALDALRAALEPRR